MVPDVERAIAALTGTPLTLDVARPLLPREGGLYAWWISNRALAPVGVPANPHPTLAELDLLYVGIAPSGATSRSTLRSRVIGNHMRGNIAASTLRRTLAALLLEVLKLRPVVQGDKVQLPKEQNTELGRWQHQHLRLTWHAVPKPWLLESTVIAKLRPPLNLVSNQDHAFYSTLSEARRRLQQAAR
jgi:GIY-YIG catalytic domain-containing protein